MELNNCFFLCLSDSCFCSHSPKNISSFNYNNYILFAYWLYVISKVFKIWKNVLNTSFYFFNLLFHRHTFSTTVNLKNVLSFLRDNCLFGYCRLALWHEKAFRRKFTINETKSLFWVIYFYLKKFRRFRKIIIHM